MATTHKTHIASEEGLNRIADAINGLAARQTLTYDSAKGRYDNASIKTWLTAQADGKAYGVSIPKSAATGCTKTGANSGIANPVPGIIGRPAVDPYVGKGAFRFYEVNGGVDADGTPYVTAFRGDGRFSRTASDVWILTPVLYWAHSETSSTVEISVSDTKLSGMEVQPQGVLPSGAQRPFMLYAKYWLGEGDGYSRSGQAPALFDVSHNSLVTSLKASTTGYSGFSFADYWYQRVMFMLKYASKNSQSVFAGASNYSVDAAISVAASSQPYVIVSSADAAKFVVGSTVSVGSRTGYKGDARQEACTRDIADRVTILSIIKHDDSNMRLVLDAPAMTTSTAAHVVTMPYRTGACDGVEGDGSPHSCTDGREPFVLQGIELMGGMYEILGDVVFHSTGSGWGVYVNPDSKDEKTAYDASVHIDTGLMLPSGDGVYPLYPGISKQGMLVSQGTGGSTSAGLCDAKWGNADTDTGYREFPSCGILEYGGRAGLWCVYGRNRLGTSWWTFGSRASATGRGVRTA